MRAMSEMASAGALLELIRAGEAATRADLRRLTGLSRTAVVSRVSALIDSGLLLLGAELASTGGRPAGALLFNQGAGVVLAVAIGRSRSQLGVFDLAGREIVSDTRDHGPGIAPGELLPDVVKRLDGLLSALVEATPVYGIGVSLPGVVDAAGLRSVDSPVMRGWDGVDLAPYFGAYDGVPIFLANDADVLARSELLGPGETPRNALVLKASTGLGLAVVADGAVLSGAGGAVGEIGHTRIDRAAGVPCRCGAEGCLEAIAGGWALVNALRDSGVEAGHVRDLVASALAGDAIARGLLRDSGRQVGEVLAIAINLLNPEVVVVGGDMGQAFDVYAAGIRESVYARSTAFATRDLQFLPAAHGDASGLVGCAALAIDHVLAPAEVDARLG